MKKSILVLLVFLSIPICNFAQSFDEAKLLDRLKTLSSDAFEGRRTGEKGNAMAQEYIIKEFKKLNVDAFGSKYKHAFSFKAGGKEYNGVNVLAQFKGTEYPNKYVVVSAHYDHLGVKDGKVYNGADDDASGIAALFSFAEYLSKNPPKHTVVLAAFDAEELGLQGAKYFVEKMKNTTIVTNLNMDMISRSPKNEIYVVGTRYNKNLKAIVEKFKNPTSTKLLVGHDGTDGKQDWTYSSDHGPFHRAKIPFLYFGDEDHPGYHNPTDDFENITPEFYKNSVKIILSLFKEIDKSGL
ncbi:M20/M25/M40 family metallo-hydrolase [Flavobacteriaceae bacterium R38]|nr:M20/M25/M40 family metallo-hydrolase [Flavobacteriaceae bacterium R38]